MYIVRFSNDAQRDVALLRQKAPQAFKKFLKLVAELEEHPRTGTGQIEQLKYFKNETWSRRITREHRLVYEIHDDQVLVIVVSSFGHYV